MPDYWIKVRGRPRVRVDYGWRGTPSEKGKEGETPTSNRVEKGSSASPGSLAMGFGMIERLEIRVEAASRPDERDVEVQYVLTGSQPNSPDRMHTLAADYIVPNADERSIQIMFGKLIDTVRQDRPETVGLFMQVHSHPSNGIPEPSRADRNMWQDLSSVLSESFPGATILFGVHGVSQQHPNFLKRTSPVKISPNTLSWDSNTREHKLGIFTPSATPYQVSYVD